MITTLVSGVTRLLLSVASECTCFSIVKNVLIRTVIHFIYELFKIRTIKTDYKLNITDNLIENYTRIERANEAMLAKIQIRFAFTQRSIYSRVLPLLSFGLLVTQSLYNLNTSMYTVNYNI